MSSIFPTTDQTPTQEEWDDFPRRVGLVGALALGWRPRQKMQAKRYFHRLEGPSTFSLGQDLVCNFLQHCEHPRTKTVIVKE